MFQSNSYADNVNVFAPNLFITFDSNQYLFKERMLSQYVPEWNRREQRWRREIFERERYWGHLSGNDYAEGFRIGKITDLIL